MLSNTERIARGLLKHYLPTHKVVFNARPEWIINPETNQALEIDIMYPDLKLCVECQGVQHYRYTPGLHKDYDDFVRQQKRDTIKMHAIQAAGYQFEAFSIFELLPDRFDPLIKKFMRDRGMLSQYEHVLPPRALYAQAAALTHSKVKTNKRPYRKSGLWPLLQRMWWKHKQYKKGQSRKVYG